jgi:hypothetical protein
MFLEHKHLYRQTYNKAPNPGPNFMIPLGKAKVVRPGTDLTVITYGALVQRALWAAREAEEHHGISAEVVDLRSLSPVDWEAIGESVRKTNRVIVAYEDSLSWGYGAEIAARISQDLFAWLDAPVQRVASTDTFVAYAPELEDVILPQTADLRAAMEQIVRCSLRPRRPNARRSGPSPCDGPRCRDRLAAVMPLCPRNRETCFASDGVPPLASALDRGRVSGSIHTSAFASLGTLNSAIAAAPPLRHGASHQYDPVPRLSTRKCCRPRTVRMVALPSRHTDDSMRQGRADAVSKVTSRPRAARGRRPAGPDRAAVVGPGSRGSSHLDQHGSGGRPGRAQRAGPSADELRRTRQRRGPALPHPRLLPR